MPKHTDVPISAKPPCETNRYFDLIAFAVRNNIDSDDLDDACVKFGLDPETADLRHIDKAIKDTFGQPPMGTIRR